MNEKEKSKVQWNALCKKTFEDNLEKFVLEHPGEVVVIDGTNILGYCENRPPLELVRDLKNRYKGVKKSYNFYSIPLKIEDYKSKQ
jgi:PP-loop superfamily ATP-utilizing enzyme